MKTDTLDIRNMDCMEPRASISSDLLADYKRALFATSEKKTMPGNGMFGGMEINVLTLPLPDGVVGLYGLASDPENAVFLKG